MPITPLHFGPGLALKGIAPRGVSFLAFAASQVITDTEPFYWIFIANEFPYHRFFHTLPGACVVAFLAILTTWPILKWLGPFWNQRLPEQLTPAWSVPPGSPPLPNLAMGAFLGSFSHVFLDMIMHSDVLPFAPWSPWSGPLGWLSPGGLMLVCLVSGIIGLTLIHFRHSPSHKSPS
ncbi:MAG: hypothetical protein HQL52_10195 [Magnetococcales bacterium]|nr:hypothetical protein [Magnetococcales bacterium]